MKLTTAFFDLDGVLWNSEEAHYEAFQKVATKHRENYLNLSHAFAETWVCGIETSQVFLNAFSWMGVDISDNELLNLIDNLANMFDDFVVDLSKIYDKEVENEMQIKQKEQEKWESIHKNFPEEFKNENTK